MHHHSPKMIMIIIINILNNDRNSQYLIFKIYSIEGFHRVVEV